MTCSPSSKICQVGAQNYPIQGRILSLLVGSVSHFHFTFPIIYWPVPCLKKCQVYIFSKRIQLTRHGREWMRPELLQWYMAKVSNCLNFPRRPIHTDMAEHSSQINLTASSVGIRTFLIKHCSYFLMKRPTVLSNIRKKEQKHKIKSFSKISKGVRMLPLGR